MKGFIEVTTKEGKRLINIRGILEIIPEDEDSTIVFTECEFKSHQVCKTYGKVKGLIKKSFRN